MTARIGSLLGMLLLAGFTGIVSDLTWATSGAAECGRAELANAVEAAKTAVADACQCDGFEKHRAFVRCAKAVAKATLKADFPECVTDVLSTVMECAFKSVCGLDEGKVICCRRHNGHTEGVIVSDASKCVPKEEGDEVCLADAGYTDCCSACVEGSDDTESPCAAASRKPAESVCGNGIVESGVNGRRDCRPDEQCDDGNLNSNDGCSSTCTVEPSWSCLNPTDATTGRVGPSSCGKCGDGVINGTEECDDTGSESGDGCSASCRLEPGYSCPEAGKQCTAICGDGIVVGQEKCDDGNLSAEDGCSPTCTIELGQCGSCGAGVCTNACTDTVSFNNINDAVPGKFFKAAASIPDAGDPNTLILGLDTGLDSQTLKNRDFKASQQAFFDPDAADTINFVITAPCGYTVAKVTYTEKLVLTDVGPGRAFGMTQLVVNGIATALKVVEGIDTQEKVIDLTGGATCVPMSITTSLVAAPEDAELQGARVTVQVLPLAP